MPPQPQTLPTPPQLTPESAPDYNLVMLGLGSREGQADTWKVERMEASAADRRSFLRRAP